MQVYQENMPDKPILVIKCGGSILQDKSELYSLIHDIYQIMDRGFLPIIVHGGGPDINLLCEKLSVKSNFVNGLRITSKEILDITQMALLGQTNAALVQSFNLKNIPAVGLSGHDTNLLMAEFVDQKNLGYVGKIVKVNNDFLTLLLNNKILPVIAPLAIDGNGNTFNVNADMVAAAIAISSRAKRLILLSDIDGYYANYPEKDSLVKFISKSEVEVALNEPGKVIEGMKPKLTSCLEATTNGVTSAHIINGKVAHGLLKVVEFPSSIGTTIE